MGAEKVRSLLFVKLAISSLLLGAGACSGGNNPNILDAAEIYKDNTGAFADILSSYPGPHKDFTRIPARDPAKETPADNQFLKQLRKTFPVEFIDFFPRSGAGTDEVNVVIKRYGINTRWTIVSLVYFSKPLAQPEAGSKMALFDECDARSLDWIETNKTNGSVSVFCHVDRNWYAFQQVD